MPTISSMLRGTYLLYKNYYSSKNSSTSTASNSFLKNYSSPLIKNNFINDYSTTKKNFNSELNESLDKLKNSSAEVKNLDFKTIDDPKKIVDTIKNFADNYNDTIKFFNDNSNVSNQVKNLTKIFSNTNYNSRSAANIGIKIDSSGKMTVDNDQLEKSINENSTRVESVMSSLTSKSDRNVSFAESQQNKIFPSIRSMIGGSINSSSLYNSRSLTKISNYASVGNLLNYFV